MAAPPLSISVKADVAKAIQQLNAYQREQIPFATAYALTQCAKSAQREVEKEIPRVFDRPTPFTRQAIRIRPATKTRLWSEVKLKDEAVKGNPAVRWLIAQIRGGARTPKGFERLMQRAGVMPIGWYAVPTRNAPLDAYGNVPGGVINRILSQLQASRFNETNESAALKKRRNSVKLRAKKRPSRYFVALPGGQRTAHLTPGIWERVGFGFGLSIRPVFIYTDSPPKYRVRLQFNRIVNDTVKIQFGLQFRRGLALALRTAR